MTEWQIKLLKALSEDGGFTTGVAARNAWGERLPRRIQSAWARIDLLFLESNGLVARMDDQKPVC